jgi:hypothetical protein
VAALEKLRVLAKSLASNKTWPQRTLEENS